MDIPHTIAEAREIAENGDGETLVNAFGWLVAKARDDEERAMLNIIIDEIKARCDIALASTDHR